MKRLAWLIIAAGILAVGSGSGCLVTQDNDEMGDCSYQHEVCETYCDPYGNCEQDCWYEEREMGSCNSGSSNNSGGSGDFCYSDVECSDSEVCVNSSCQAPDTDERGEAGLCQACETNSDCNEAGALCVRLTGGEGQDARVCTTPCDGGCPSGFECESINGSAQCLPEADASNERSCDDSPELECVTASDCATGESCVNNSCEAPDDAECDADADCSGGQICDRHQCVDDVSECQTRQDCRSGEVCIDDQCEAGTESCVFNSECSGDAMCVDGTCYPTCSADDECSRYEHCRQGLCQPTQCRGTSDCAGDEVCVDATCMPGCDPSSSTDDCGTGYVCTSNGFCDRDPDVECRSSAECSRQEICLEGSCEEPCECNSDCPDGNVCDLDSGTCHDPGSDAPTTCESICDCASGDTCNDSGECVSG
ncbi:MAG: hypothetical protein ACLFVJ_09345 [Persicimonas sp.]